MIKQLTVQTKPCHINSFFSRLKKEEDIYTNYRSLLHTEIPLIFKNSSGGHFNLKAAPNRRELLMP